MTQKPYVKSGRRKRIGIMLLASLFLVLVAFVLFAETSADRDLFGHLTYGQRILETGQIPTYDLYSYTTGQREWINHEWLSEVVFGLLHNVGGLPAFHYLRTAYLLIFLLLFYELYRRVSPTENTVTYCFLAGLSLLIMYPYVMVRPQLFSFVLAQLVLLVFLQADRRDPRYLLVLPVLFVVWTNTHGGFIAGLGLVGVYGVCSFPRSRTLFRYTLLGLLGSGLATFLNPYGAGLHEQIYRTLDNPWTDRVIEDWLPLHATSMVEHPSLIVVLIVYGVHTVLFVRSRKTWTRNTLFVLSTVCFVAGLLHVRNVAFYALVGIPSLASLPEGIPDGVPSILRRLWLAGTLVAVGVFVGHFGSLEQNPDGRYPEAAVEYLRNHASGGNLATPFNWGQYAIYHLHPKFRVSLDGRYDTVYPVETFVDFQLKVYRGTQWEEILREYGTDYVLVPNDSPLKDELERSNHPATFRGPRATVYKLSRNP